MTCRGLNHQFEDDYCFKSKLYYFTTCYFHMSSEEKQQKKNVKTFRKLISIAHHMLTQRINI